MVMKEEKETGREKEKQRGSSPFWPVKHKQRRYVVSAALF